MLIFVDGQPLDQSNAEKLAGLFSQSFTSGGSLQIWGAGGKAITLGATHPSGHLTHPAHHSAHHASSAGPVHHMHRSPFVRSRQIR